MEKVLVRNNSINVDDVIRLVGRFHFKNVSHVIIPEPKGYKRFKIERCFRLGMEGPLRGESVGTVEYGTEGSITKCHLFVVSLLNI